MLTLSDFLETLGRSRLVDRARVDEICSRLGPKDSNDLAAVVRALVERKALTKFQAAKLLAGKDGPFFLGSYKILNQLGAGGMGKVYLARNTETRRKVAIKVLPPKRAAAEGNALGRFLREGTAGRRLSHPNVAEVLEVGQDGAVHYLVMEYIPGQSLHDMVQRGGPLRVPDAARLFSELAAGLGHIHEVGVVHRDIKPSNIMVTPDGNAKLLDLGLARSTEEEDEGSPLTRVGTIIGTMDYIAPEQALGQPADQRSDIYSLGCTLYHALSGRAPFPGGDAMSKVYRHRLEDPEPLERVANGIPAEFAALVRKMMAKDPADRYASALELIHDLQRWRDRELVRKLVGSAAETGQVFRSPPPEIDDSEMHVGEGSLRSLGHDEPLEAPIRRAAKPSPAAPRGFSPPAPLQRLHPPAPEQAAETSDSPYVALAIVLGLGAILIIALAVVFYAPA